MRKAVALMTVGLLSLSLCAGCTAPAGDSFKTMPSVCVAAGCSPAYNLNSSAASSSDTEHTLLVTLDGSSDISYLYKKTADRYSLTADYLDDSFIISRLTSDRDSLQALISELSAIPGVISVEEDSPLTLTAISDDLYSDSQWSLYNPGIYSHIEGSTSGNILTTPDIDIDAPEGWELYSSLDMEKQPVVVAVIDTGIDYRHPDLADSMWINTGEIDGNGIDDDGNGYVDDIYGWDFYNNDATICHYDYNAVYDAYLSSAGDCDDHGTHVAGIIAAEADNAIGIAGAASCVDVKLMSLKIHGGSNRSGNVSDAIKAIRYADSMGAQICNMSWGSYIESTALYTAIERSHMLFVCAAGNSGTDNDERPLFPACYGLDNVISVAHIDANGNLTYDSNYGKNTVDVAVPATDIYSTFVGTYSSLSGSSMAAPHVTAIAAAIYSLGQGIYPSEVKTLITASIKPLDNLNGFIRYPGIPSLYLALLGSEMLLFDTEAPVFRINRSFSGESILLSFETEDGGGSGIHFMRYIIGPHDSPEFKKGTAGTVITGNTLALSKSGLYTFYLSDNAGNESVRTAYIMDDVLPPVFTDTTYSVNNKLTRLTLSSTVRDADSGVKTVKFLKGRHTVADFEKDGTSLTLGNKNKVSFSVADEGTYTLYAVDRRGNAAVTYIYAYIRRSTDITVDVSELILEPGDMYPLITVLSPARTTDKLTYRSSDSAVASVSSKGVITAASEGTALISVTASSGLTASCQVTVTIPSDSENEGSDDSADPGENGDPGDSMDPGENGGPDEE